MKKVVAFISDLLTRNPVVFNASALAPIVVAGISFKNALLLSIVMLIVTIPTILLSHLLFEKLPDFYKVPSIFLLASFMGILASIAIIKMDSVAFESLGIYLPILSVNSILLVNSLSGSRKNYLSVVRNAFIGVLCFVLVVFVVSIIREFIGSGTVFGNEIHSATIPGALFPFFGYFIVAFIGAIIKAISAIIKRRDK